MGANCSKYKVGLALALLGLSGCAITMDVEEPCVISRETKALLGIITSTSITIGPSVERVTMIGEGCEAHSIMTPQTMEVETHNEIPQNSDN